MSALQKWRPYLHTRTSERTLYAGPSLQPAALLGVFFFLCVSEKGVCLLVSNVISVLSFNDLVCDATSL